MAAPLPDLIEEMVREILLRCPPDDPARLVRAAVVSKRWRRICSSRGFLSRYRELHGGPPLIGFFHKSFLDFDRGPSTICIPTTAPPWPFATAAFDDDDDHAGWHIRDCRHGRVLIETFVSPGQTSSTLVVWDPITTVQTKVPLPYCPGGDFAAAVFCGVDGCDHLHCHAGPFQVVLLVPLVAGWGKWSCVYSSEAGAWGARTSHRLPGPLPGSAHSLYEELGWYDLNTHVVIAGDALYFKLDDSKGILKYGIVGARGLSVINMSPVDEVKSQKVVLVTMKDGSRLGVAYMVCHDLHLWTCHTGHNGVVEWGQHRVVHLKDDRTLPLFNGDRPREVDLVGFAEGADTIFFSISTGIYTFNLRSSQVEKVYDGMWHFFPVFPFFSFCSPALGVACTGEGCGAGASSA